MKRPRNTADDKEDELGYDASEVNVVNSEAVVEAGSAKKNW